MKPGGIYIHIPFCKSRCSYCDFATDVYRSNEVVERYVDALCNEVRTASVRGRHLHEEERSLGSTIEPPADAGGSDRASVDTIAESCFSSLGRDAIGASIDLSSNGLSSDSLLFGESPSRIVISFAAENLDKVTALAGDCPFEVIGKVSGENLTIRINESGAVLVKVTELEEIWWSSLQERLE